MQKSNGKQGRPINAVDARNTRMGEKKKGKEKVMQTLFAITLSFKERQEKGKEF